MANTFTFCRDRYLIRLERPIPSYLIGTRGTGKTTLLKALNWKERITNDSLKRQLPADAFAQHYVGVYLKLPEIQLGAFAARLSKETDALRTLIPSLYIDVISLQLLVNGLAELIAKNLIICTPQEESACVRSIIEQFPLHCRAREGVINQNPSCTLKHLLHELRLLQAVLDDFAIFGGIPSDILPQRFPKQIGELGRFVASKLDELCNRHAKQAVDKWHFKICMDEGECLEPEHQRVLNTVVRLSRWPLFYVICFVGRPDDISGTYLPNLTLADDDRQLLLLDEMDDVTFRTLGEGVASVRIQEIEKDPTLKFNTRRCFGKLKINELMLSILENSVKVEAKRLLESATAKRREPFFEKEDIAVNDVQDNTEANNQDPPIYQVYLIEKLNLKMTTPHDPHWIRRAQDSANIRKKMVAAYLSLCWDLRTEVRYSSADMILQMSDNCVRDFLRFVNEIFLESGLTLRKFIEERIPNRIQDFGIKRASEQKRNSLKQSGVLAPTEVGRIIDALAEITQILQTQGPNNSQLVATERGLFVVDFPASGSEQSRKVVELLRDAAEAGFLRLLYTGTSSLKFRVHTSLAAVYGFSYRGAYYQTPLSIADIDQIRQCADHVEFKRAVKRIGKQLSGCGVQTDTLFESEELR